MGSFAALACAAFAIYTYRPGAAGVEWWWMGGALLTSALSQLGVTGTRPCRLPRVDRASRWKTVFGGGLAVAGAGLFGWGSWALYHDWNQSFGLAWLAWLGGTAILGVGLDMMWGRSEDAVAPFLTRREVVILTILLLVALLYRFGGLSHFPGPASVTQVEELQAGNWGMGYLHGFRGRWEFIGHIWTAAAGMFFLGPTLLGMRVGFALISALKVLPLYFWLRAMVGIEGAIVGAALLAHSGWDVVLARIPTNHDTFTVALAFALLARPARRGRPSAYVWLGLIGGYILYQYVAYRPLALLVLIGATVLSVRDQGCGWFARIGRPTVCALLIAAMVWPLFFGRIRGRISNEYLNGWNRAHAIRSYYNPHDSWAEATTRRLDRMADSASLFFFRGDPSPVRNVHGRPLLDPVTGVLLVVGLGVALARLRDPVVALTAAGFLVTVGGTMVATGNFDVVRVGSAVTYIYALVGLGAGGVILALRRAAGKWGALSMMIVALMAVVGAGVSNTTFLFELWSSPRVKKALRNNLAYLTHWLALNTSPGQRVTLVAPRYGYVLKPNDASWMLGRKIPGVAADDVETALDTLLPGSRETTLVLFAGPGTKPLQAYCEWLFGRRMTFVSDPLNAGGDLAYTALPDGGGVGWRKRRSMAACRGARATFVFTPAGGQASVAPVTVRIPMIDDSTWPAGVRGTVYRNSRKIEAIQVSVEASFRVQRAGSYALNLRTPLGRARMKVDGRDSRNGASVIFPTDLAEGTHTIRITATFPPLAQEPGMQLYWRGPDTAGESRILPFYRIGVADPECLASGELDPLAAAGGGA